VQGEFFTHPSCWNKIQVHQYSEKQIRISTKIGFGCRTD
jgi:hypothetical protein